MRKGDKIYSPDHISKGLYKIGDLIEYFEGIRKKWEYEKKYKKEQEIKEIREKIGHTVTNVRMSYESILADRDATFPKHIREGIRNAINKLKGMEKELKNKPE